MKFPRSPCRLRYISVFVSPFFFRNFAFAFARFFCALTVLSFESICNEYGAVRNLRECRQKQTHLESSLFPQTFGHASRIVGSSSTSQVPGQGLKRTCSR